MGIKLPVLDANEKNKEKPTLITKLITVGLIVLTILVIGAFFRNLSKLKKAKERIAEKEKEINELRKKNDEIKDRLKEISSEAYIEKQLRDNLGMSKEGEKVIVLPDEETLKGLVPEINKTEEETKLPNWKMWLDFFGF